MLHFSPRYHEALEPFRRALEGPADGLDERGQALVRLALALAEQNPQRLVRALVRAKAAGLSSEQISHAAALTGCVALERIADGLGLPHQPSTCCG